MTFYDVLSLRNSNVPKHNVILTSAKNVTWSNKKSCKYDILKNTSQWRTKAKRNCNVILKPYSNVPKYSAILTLSKNNYIEQMNNVILT